MFKSYNVVGFCFMCKYLFVTGQNCDIICNASECKTITNNPNITVTTNYSNIPFCTKEDIPSTVNFTVEDEDKISIHPAILNISFTVPRKKCMYKIILLANESINEKDCVTHDFQNLYDEEVHTSTRTMCFFPNNTHYLESIDSMSFPYIFKACYAVQFNYGEDKYININKFLKTQYKRTEVTKPQFKCTYKPLYDSSKGDILYFDMNLLLVSLVSKVTLNLGLVDNSTGLEICDKDNPLLKNNTWNIEILEDYKKNMPNVTVLRKKKYIQNLQFNITPIGNVNYCTLIYVVDRRCKHNTLWKPPENTCAVYKDCYLAFNHQIDHSTAQNKINTNTFLYWIIISTLLSIFIILVIIYFIYIAKICICGKKLCTKVNKNNIQIIGNFDNELNVLKKKGIKVCKNLLIVRTDIVLLYPKGSEFFMALMAEFRENLNMACQCPVFDWYDPMECNYVAKIGGSEWFAEILNKGSRIIWVDTPTTRVLITQRFKNDFVEICDFRDTVFPTIFDLAKRSIEHSVLQQNKHFIVRVNGFDSFENEYDPFSNWPLNAPYIIPQDLNLLYLDLALLK